MDTKLLEKKMENISPFELKNRLIDMADESGLQPPHAKHSSFWENSDWKNVVTSCSFPKELPEYPKSKALPPALNNFSRATPTSPEPNYWNKPITIC